VTAFSILYSEKHPVATQIEGSTLLEATWTIIPLGLFLVMFVWGSLLYFRIYTPPPNAMNIYVVGKQWMWKAEHPGGQHEINSLHVPDRPADPTDADLAGCLSQLLDSRLPREARGDSGPLHDGLV
jgi:heme/copper-type cytochrome/quinol oxidase subunit 2